LTGIVVGYPNRLRVVILIVIGSKFTLEALQLLTPDWLGCVIDAIVEAAGGICEISIGYLATLLLHDKTRIKES